MASVRASTAGALFALLGVVDPAFAQAGQEQEQLGLQNPVARSRQVQLHQQARQLQTMRRSQQQAVTWQQQRGWLAQGSSQGHSKWRLGRAWRWESEQRSWLRRGGLGGIYFPQDRFSLPSGIQQYFRIQSRLSIYPGNPRLNYNGFVVTSGGSLTGILGRDF